MGASIASEQPAEMPKVLSVGHQLYKPKKLRIAITTTTAPTIQMILFMGPPPDGGTLGGLGSKGMATSQGARPRARNRVFLSCRRSK